MKNRILVNSLVVFVLLLLSCSCNRQALPTAKVNYLSSKDGTITIKSIGVGSNEANAIMDAEKNAFNVILFRGLPASEQLNAIVGTNEAEEIEMHKEYFDSFYKEKRYQTFVMSSIPTSSLIKLKGGGKSISVDVKVNITALRKDLEQNNIIRKFGF